MGTPTLPTVALCAFCVVGCLADDLAWEVLDPGTLPDVVLPTRPTVRYGSTAAWVDGLGVVLTHGYRFNHAHAGAQWFGDSWVFDVVALKWNKFRQPRSATANPPTARYKSTITDIGDGTLLLIGGDDGGHLYHPNHQWGAYTNEVVPFHTRKEEWGAAYQNFTKFQPRQGHAAALYVAPSQKKYILIFGGMKLDAHHIPEGDSSKIVDTNQLIFYDVAANDFEDVTPDDVLEEKWSEEVSNWPHPRRSHGLCVIGGTAYLFGGFAKREDYKNTNDLWKLDIASRVWTRIPEASTWPTKRGGMVFECDAGLGSEGTLVLYAGALCAPGCSCTTDIWLFDIYSQTWSELIPSRGMKPLNRHFHSGVIDPVNHYLYIFGGESYRPYVYMNDVWRISLDGKKPDERLVDGSAVYEGLGMKSLMAGGAKVREELEALRPDEYKEHDEMLKAHRAQQGTGLEGMRQKRYYDGVKSLVVRVMGGCFVVAFILYKMRHRLLKYLPKKHFL